jgi:hypothetical protein
LAGLGCNGLFVLVGLGCNGLFVLVGLGAKPNSPLQPTHTAIIRLSIEDSSTYNVCPPGNLHTQLSLGYLQKTVQHCVGRFPGGQTLYVEPSSVDNIMIAVWVGFLEDKHCMLNCLL